jgi:uncharacterized protein (TIGR02231 family)
LQDDPTVPKKEDSHVKTPRRAMISRSAIAIAILVLISAFVSIAPLAGSADDDEITLKTKIVAASVYADRAQVTRSGKVDLKAGSFKLVCDDLPQGFDESSLQVEGKGTAAVKILGVDVVRVQGQLTESPRYTELKSRLDKVNARRDSIQIEIASLNGSIEFLNNYAKYPFTEKEAKAAPDAFRTQDFKTLMDFIGSERSKTTTKVDALGKRTKKLDEEIAWVNQQLQEMQTKDNWTKRVVIDCEASSPGELRLDLTYNVTGATWRPEYMVRFDAKKETLALSYNARIQQYTGEDWKGVAVQLSTAQPQLGAAPPEISALYLTRKPPRPVGGVEYELSPSLMRKSSEVTVTASDVRDRVGAGASAYTPPAPQEFDLAREETSVATTSFAANFSIPKAVDLPSGAEPKRVLILENSLAGTLSRYAAPRLSRNVYVREKVKNTLEAPILGGSADVYVETVPAGGGQPTSNFVGKEPLGAIPTGQEFSVDLGIDQDIKATFKLEKREYLTKEGAAVKKIRYHYLITLESFKPGPAAVTVQDRVPVSTLKDVKVTGVDLSPEPSEQREDGILTWNLTPGPKEKKEIRIVYTIELPGDWPEQEINLE